jgi:hypothetical protein
LTLKGLGFVFDDIAGSIHISWIGNVNLDVVRQQFVAQRFRQTAERKPT